ncbi:hypothetical protein HYV73_03205 [Candidatus Uhrbacteria bacterium]|nr:hypothetical protein [Candidatus Uhrbacteria bacterium]
MHTTYSTNKSFLVASLLALVLFPESALAKSPYRPGTDDYLRQVLQRTDAQLAQGLVTEKREPFHLVEGIGQASDPMGDVLSKVGTSTPLALPWSDLVSADLRPNDAIDSWNIVLELADAFPETFKKGQKVNVTLFFDADGDSTNDAMEGVSAGTDTEFRLVYDEPSGQWQKKFRWYNKEATFWAVDKETIMTYKIQGDTIMYEIPYTELPKQDMPRWRAMIAIEDGSNTAVDVLPEAGFPPPKGETYPLPASPPPNLWFAFGGGIIVLLTPVLWWRIKLWRSKRKTSH